MVARINIILTARVIWCLSFGWRYAVLVCVCMNEWASEWVRLWTVWWAEFDRYIIQEMASQLFKTHYNFVVFKEKRNWFDTNSFLKI